MTDRHAPRPAAGRWILAILACAAAWSTLWAQDDPITIPTPDREHTPTCAVSSVTADCRVVLLADEQEQQVTLLGVGVPRTENSRERLQGFLANLLEAETVFVQYEPASTDDPHTPRSAWLFRAPDGLFVNLEVIRQGYAKVKAKPAGEHLKLLRHYERRAKQARKGVWAPRPQTKPAAKSHAAPVSPPAASGETIVYVTKSGKKYHRQDCYHLRKSSIPLSLKEAVRRGYEPCSHCKPPVLKNP